MIPKLWLLSVIILSIVLLLLLFSSYFVLDSIPFDDNMSEKTATTLSKTEVQGSDSHSESPLKTSFYIYLLTLIIGLVLASYRAYSSYQNTTRANKSKRKTGIHNVHYWLNYEWRLFQLYTISLLQLLQISTIITFNSYLILSSSTENKMRGVSSASAQLAITNIAFSVLLSARQSFLQRYIFSVKETIAWHAWFGWIAFMEALYHATFHLQPHPNAVLTPTTTSSSSDFPFSSSFLSIYFSVRSITGLILLSSLSLLMIGSHSFVRKFISYRFFRSTHLIAFSMLILFGIMHHELFFTFYVAVALFWIVDQMQRSNTTDIVGMDVLPGHIVKLTCRLPTTVAKSVVPGQFMTLSFQSSWAKSLLFAHPFSISRVENDRAIFYVKCQGKQTSKLLRKVTASANTSQTIGDEAVNMKIRISQPLGKPQCHKFTWYERVFLIAEGMGITPWLSVLQYYGNGLIQDNNQTTRCLDLIWSIHTIDTFYAFKEELEHYIQLFGTSNLTFHLHVFITGQTSDIELHGDLLPLSAIRSEEKAHNQLVSFDFSRPHYHKILTASPATIPRSQRSTANNDIAIGICAHESTMVQINNLSLFHGWSVLQKERFEY
ncbi:hypothetical protein BDF20DRAFT_895805 [Mycotypha africana]|uniref:uncharacterized protein n=1 Tax=Mycotypha africana TaxID=64632 RepID=UPI00230061E4|nr:uncharacterized protein BDF20DRAFT_895805 [Mycotypha africana]KAI8968339.1 hypothetical protein BDF20DRAFT_895805 [Mycotypha africana]